ncbi:MAG: hypothetical protein J6W57_00750, partial [Oscillospiraceae bacterium]|nr:hypothetical protein [Oscillospiraceae bacterium]
TFSVGLPRKTAVVIPAPVGYSSQAFSAGNYDPRLRVAAQMISFAYLWNEVRVKGGAYVTGFAVRRNASVSTYSYRDPSPEKSIAVNGTIGDFLRGFCQSGQKVDGFIISAIADMDPLMSPAEMGQSADNDWFTGFTRDDAAEERRQMLEITNDDLREIAGLTDRFASLAPYCIVAGEALITDKDSVEIIKI